MEAGPHAHPMPSHERSKSSVFRNIVLPNSRTTSPSKTGALSALPNGHYAINSTGGAAAQNRNISIHDTGPRTYVSGEEHQDENAPPRSPEKMIWSTTDTPNQPQKENSRPKDLRTQKSTTKLASFFSRKREDVVPVKEENQSFIRQAANTIQAPPASSCVKMPTSEPCLNRNLIETNLGSLSRGLAIMDQDALGISYGLATAPNQTSSATSWRDFETPPTPGSSTQSRGRPGRRRTFDEERILPRPETISNVKATVAMFNEKSNAGIQTKRLSGKDLESAFEAVLVRSLLCY